MTMRDDRTRLLHIRDHVAEAVALAEGKTRSELETDRLLNLSLVRLLEIVGQSAARVSEETQRQYPQIPWQDIAGLRDRLLHGYDTVDLDILWNIVHDDLPPLVERIQKAATGGIV
ncbi:MAG: DUF86 domain-containing protein [Planctomycetes bacterium]|nr:DUF86 domain-containing protein [Planctomycetota bacterium]MBU4399896.1 DUF86 domain-containing protein [Planctomycetota bacterium]MCG2683156.1 DUF86 domain-containing protein [Planctomycetales bacterium]